MSWFRVYTEIIDDAKLRRVPPAQRWLWVAVLAVAKASPEPGRLLLSVGVPADVDDLAVKAGMERDEVAAGLAAFRKLRMVRSERGVYVVANWGKRQFVSDDVGRRVRAHRERSGNVPSADEGTSGGVSGNGFVTLQERSEAVTVTGLKRPQSTETDTETDTERLPPLPPAGPDPPPGAPRPSPSGYVEVLDSRFPKISASYTEADPVNFTAGWLRGALAEAEAEIGPLDRDRLTDGLDVALTRVQEALRSASAEYPIRHPRAFAKRTIVEALREVAG